MENVNSTFQLPENILKLFKHVSLNEFIDLQVRRGVIPQDPFCRLADTQKEQEIMTAWYDFHQGVAYPSFSAFYDKELFCQKIEKIPLNREQFIQLICDQSFLFLKYADHYNDPEYPLLIDVITNYKNNTDISNDFREKANLVYQRGLIPTNALAKEYERFKRRVSKMNDAIQLRSRDIERTTYLDSQIDIQICNDGTEPTEMDLKLGKLFRSYMLAVANQAYTRKYYKVLEQNAPELCLPGICAVRRWLQEYTGNRPCDALIIWALFTSETKRLATGQLRKFKFRMKTHLKRDERPEQMQETRSRKIACNILLFDHLLDLLSPDRDARALAKYQFYAFTRYDRFVHYKTDAKNICDFDSCLPDPADCVDQLGGLIRYNIDHCLMNTTAWLNRAPTLQTKELLNSLTGLLMHDATLMPTNRRLTDRIRLCLLDEEKSRHMIKRYQEADGNTTRVLQALVNENGLHFWEAHAFLDQEEMQDPHLAQCERMLLEFALKEKTLIPYYRNLCTKVADLFPSEWFLSDTVFCFDH